MQFFTAEKIEKQLADVRQSVYRDIREIPRFKFREGACPGAETPEYDDGDWQEFHTGSTWGSYDVQVWFRTTVPIPPGWNEKRLYLRFLVGPRDGGDSTAETLLYVNGQPLQGIDIWHEEAWLPPELIQDDDCIHIALKAWSGVLGVPDRRRFKVAQLIWIDEATEQLYHSSRVLLEAIKELDQNDLRRVRLLQALNDAFYELDLSRSGSPDFYHSAQKALALLQERLAALQGMDTRLKPTVAATGHAHIDMAWLWRLSHTREKAARTFSTTLHLMRQYPEYRFMHSSPQLYDYLEQDYPDIFKRVKERIEAGQWEITGGMWVESDVNIPNGESLVRQFLLGQRYIREKFGVQCRLLWLPDAFGYSWALPQIARQSGIDYFLTSKISWNQFNRFPYDTFRWRGIDGTELLTYFITTPSDDDPSEEGFHLTYNGQLSPWDVKGTWDFYQQKEVNDELLTLFGWGDGGGGPTREMLESGRVLRDLPGFPQVQQELSETFFARLAERLKEEALPVWDDELYLELHRGTYTSQAYNKRANRLSEVLYHNTEWLSALADILRAQDNYPAQCLREGWELILLNQFHDILPGSSIRQVYEDSREDYERIFEIGHFALQGAQERLQAGLQLNTDSLVVYNALSWQRDDLLSLPWSPQIAGKVVQDQTGNPLPAQIVQADGERRLLLYVSDVPSLGYATFPLVEAETRVGEPQAVVPTETMTVTPTLLENDYYRLQLNHQGQLTSIWDKRHEREVLAPGARGNVLQAFVDRPLKFDAWDIDIYYQEKAHEVEELLEAEVEACGPLRGVLRLRWCFRDSVITQRLILYAHSPRIDFETEVEWQESQILLKVAFPVAVRATNATYGIQFGSIQRPTHWNTSWDYARFEVVGHKWADLSENGYGVALLNDCKYGYDVKDNVMRLTLIKSSVRPDPQADKGYHRFTYSLLPHTGDWRQGDVARHGDALNSPLIASVATARRDGVQTAPPHPTPRRYAFASVDVDNVILETVKRAEDGDGWIVRLFECCQRRRPDVRLTFGSKLCDAVPCNLLEEAVDDPTMEREDNSLTFAMRPYQIKSFRVRLQVDRER